jgi:regulator of sigma E protease
LIYKVVAPIFVLGLIVFVHELGHFIAAKRSGVLVHKFSLGFGPRLLGFTYGDTEYALSLIPFGGYVKMAGENPEEAGREDYEFMAKPKRVRALIVGAGPVMNFVMAVVLYTGLSMYFGVETIPTMEVGSVVEDSPAWEAGIRSKDVVLAAGGEEVETWEDLVARLDGGLGGVVTVRLRRADSTFTARLDLTGTGSYYETGMDYHRAPVIGGVKAGGPAQEVGLREGDRVVAIDGRPVDSWLDLRSVVLPSPGRELEFVWERAGSTMTAVIVPREVDGQGLIEATQKIETRGVGIIEAIGMGFDTTIWVSGQLLQLLKMLVSGQASGDMIGGPIRISELAGETLQWGFANVLALVAAISAQLSLINLLPIPVLDGGHLLFLGIEGVTGKSISTRQRVIASQIGFALLLMAILMVTFNDIRRLW